jgi:hypothetical protein
MTRRNRSPQVDGPEIPSNIRSHDPLKEAWRDSSRFNSFWLTRGKELTPVQRIGYGILSLIYASVGLLFLSLGWSCLREGDLMFIVWGLASVFLLYFGFRGIVNLFLFTRS